MKEQVMDFYNNDSNRPFEISFGQDGKTVGTMRFNRDVMTFEGEADAAATVLIDMIVKKQSQQWLDAQEKISTSEFAFNEFFQKTNWVQSDKRFDVITPWGKHRADVLKEYIDHMEAKCAALAAENAGLKQNKPDLQTMMSALDAFYADEDVPERAMIGAYNILRGAMPTPATDAFLAEVRAQGVEMFAASERKLAEKHASTIDTSSVDYGAARADDFAAQLRQDANTAELVAAGIITRIEG